MNILNALKQLRDDIKTWVTNNLNALNAKIDEKTIPIDSELSSTSTNPVQNKAITTEIADINKRVGDTSVSTQINNAIAKQPHFSGDYNDLTNAPDISEDGSGNMIIADESGNIIFKADADGIHTTAVSLNGEAAASEKYVDEAIATKVDFTGYATEEQLDNLRKEIGEGIESDAEDWKIIDEAGNIIFRVDKDGTHTTSMTLNGKEVATKEYVEGIIPEVDLTGYATEEYVDEAVANIDIPDVDFTGYATEDFVTGAIDSAKEELSESIVAESNEWKVVDEAGNIIFSIDADGAHTTNLILDGKNAATEDYVDTAIQEAQLADKEIDLTNYYTKQETEALIPDISSFLKEVPAEYVTESELTDKGYLTEHQSLVGLATTSELEAHTSDSNLHVTNAEKQQWNAKSNFSGDYKDLINAPDISEDKSGDLIIADANGNILFRSNSTGLETVNLIVESLVINGKSIQDMIRESVEEIMLGGKG